MNEGGARVKTFEDRVEEVLGLLHGMAWPLLDEPQKKKVVAKVAAGIDKGDTRTAWARALGCDEATIRRRVERFRRSEPVDGATPPTWTQDPSRIRAAKNVLKDPIAAAEVMKDPAARAAVIATVASEPRASGAPSVQTPEIDPWFEAQQVEALIDRNIRRHAQLIDEARVTAHRQEELDEWIDEACAALRGSRTKQGRAELRLVEETA
jgi:hypothetical protein